MTVEEFRVSPKLPPGLGAALEALWHEAHGDWEKAHAQAQAARSREGDWVHAYLHRKEGDEGNAAYWYSRAGRPVAQVSLDEEWSAIAGELLG
jgi:hypothetical protein